MAFSLPSVADFCLSGVLLRDKKFHRFLRFKSLLAADEDVVSSVELNMEDVEADVLAERFMALNCCCSVSPAGVIMSTVDDLFRLAVERCCRGGGVAPISGAALAARLVRLGACGSRNSSSVLAARSAPYFFMFPSSGGELTVTVTTLLELAFRAAGTGTTPGADCMEEAL